MAAVVANFFSIMGIDIIPPHTMAELIPYQCTIYVGVALVSGVFRVIGRLAEAIMDFRRF